MQINHLIFKTFRSILTEGIPVSGLLFLALIRFYFDVT